MGLMDRVAGRLNSMIARAVIARVNDAMKTQRLQLQILDEEVEDDVEHAQPYGLSFHPPAGSEAIALAIAGARSHTVAICAQHPDKRPKSAPEGTGGLYTDGQWRVFIDASGVVHVGAQAGASPIARSDYTDARITALQGKVDAVITALGAIAAKDSLNAPCVFTPWTTTLPVALGTQSTVAATKGKVT